MSRACTTRGQHRALLDIGRKPARPPSACEALDVRPGHRVLELGCGTGQVTARLVAAGAEVVAVDALPAMLVSTRRRAPSATFVEGDANDAEVGANHDHVVLSFVLHNFDAEVRTRLLRRAASALAPSGRIGVLDWALPRGRLRGVLWRRFLRALEPSPTVRELLHGALDRASSRLAHGSKHASESPAAERRSSLILRPRS